MVWVAVLDEVLAMDLVITQPYLTRHATPLTQRARQRVMGKQVRCRPSINSPLLVRWFWQTEVLVGHLIQLRIAHPGHLLTLLISTGQPISIVFHFRKIAVSVYNRKVDAMSRTPLQGSLGSLIHCLNNGTHSLHRINWHPILHCLGFHPLGPLSNFLLTQPVLLMLSAGYGGLSDSFSA